MASLVDLLGYVVNPPAGDGSLTARGDQLSDLVLSAATRASPVLFATAFGAKGDGVTDDTAAIQAAIDAASSLGTANGSPVGVVLTAGLTFRVTTLVPASNIFVWAYGAAIIQRGAGAAAIFQQLTTPFANFGVYGLTVPGTGTETSNQMVFFLAQCAGLRIYDCVATGLNTGFAYLADCQRVWVENNRLENICLGNTTAANNAINFVSSSNGAASPLQDIHCAGNHISHASAIGIDIVNSGTAARTDPALRARIVNNSVQTTGGPGWCIGVEMGGSSATIPEVADVVISGNNCKMTGTGIGIVVTNDSTPANTDPLLVDKIVISDNTVESSGSGGINCNASHAVVTGNTIEITAAAATALSMSGHGSITATGTTNNSTSVTAVTGDTGATNRDTVTGTGIPSGTYIQAGVQSGTWTLSQAATNNATETLTIRPSLRGSVIARNIIHAPSGFTGQALILQFARDSVIAENTISQEPGGASAIGIQVSQSGWITVRGNVITGLPGFGATIATCNDVDFAHNVLTNTGRGLNVNACAPIIRVIGNRITDQLATHAMTNCVSQTTASTGLEVRSNTFAGMTGAALTTQAGVTLVRDNVGYNPIGVVAVAVPASGTAVTAQPYDRSFYITAAAGGLTMAIQGGPSIVIPASAFGTVRVPAGQTVTPTYTNAPTWLVEGE